MPEKCQHVSLLSVVLIAASSGAISCASGRFDHPSLVAGETPSAELVVLRRSELAAGAFALTLELDGEKLVKLRTGRYAEFRLAPGTYQLHFDGFQAIPPATLDGLQLAAGTRTFVMFGQGEIVWGGSVGVSTSGPPTAGVTATPIMGLQVMPEERARSLMRSYEPVGEE